MAVFFKRRPAPLPVPEKPDRRAPAPPARSHQRRYYRAPVDIAVVYAYGTRTGARSALMSDLGGGGMRLETDEDMPHGTDVTVRFSLPHASHVLTAAGQVVLSFWNPLHARLAHGIAFSAIDEADQELIVKFIHEVQVEELRKRRKIED